MLTSCLFNLHSCYLFASPTVSKMLPVEMRKCHPSFCCGTGELAARLNGIVFVPPSSLGKHQPSGFQGADRLIRCDGVPCA